MERFGRRPPPLAGAGMQRPLRPIAIIRLAVSPLFVCSLSPTRFTWVGLQTISVARAVAFQAGQAGIFKSRSAASSHLWTDNDAKAKIDFEENSDTTSY